MKTIEHCQKTNRKQSENKASQLVENKEPVEKTGQKQTGNKAETNRKNEPEAQGGYMLCRLGIQRAFSRAKTVQPDSNSSDALISLTCFVPVLR
ncbi:MAG: hypothetical protein P8Z30_05870 [Acidobacteriota bacterium]